MIFFMYLGYGIQRSLTGTGCESRNVRGVATRSLYRSLVANPRRKQELVKSRLRCRD